MTRKITKKSHQFFSQSGYTWIFLLPIFFLITFSLVRNYIAVARDDDEECLGNPCPTTTPNVTASPTITFLPSPTLTPRSTSTPIPSCTPIPTCGPCATKTPSPTRTPTLTATPQATATSTPSSTQTPSPSPTITIQPTPTTTPSNNSPTPTQTPNPDFSPTPTSKLSSTPSPTSTLTGTPAPTETSTPGPTETSTPGPTETPSPGPSETPGPGPTETPGPGPTSTPAPGIGGGEESNPIVLGVTRSNTTQTIDNYNPLLQGIQDSYTGEVLGMAFPATGETQKSLDKLPSNNQLIANHYIIIPKIGLNRPVYSGQIVGGQYLAGHQEVIMSSINQSAVYYAHSWSAGFFQYLHQLTIGDTVILDIDGQSQTYQVDSLSIVAADQFSAVGTADSSIYLLTCTDSNHRLLIKAAPKQNEN